MAARESSESGLEVLRELGKRGMRPPVTIPTDGALGLTQASEARWPQSFRLRWWFQKMKNLEQKVPEQAGPAFQAFVTALRAAPSREKAEQRRAAIVAQYQREVPEACRCLLEDAAASLNHLAVPQRPQPYGRTSNLAERAFVEARRRTKVIPHLQDERRLGHLVFAVVIRVSERWNKPSLSAFEHHQIRSLRGRLKLDEPEVQIVDSQSARHIRRSAASAA